MVHVSHRFVPIVLLVVVEAGIELAHNAICVIHWVHWRGFVFDDRTIEVDCQRIDDSRI